MVEGQLGKQIVETLSLIYKFIRGDYKKGFLLVFSFLLRNGQLLILTKKLQLRSHG
jgi:hypothetical protein